MTDIESMKGRGHLVYIVFSFTLFAVSTADTSVIVDDCKYKCNREGLNVHHLSVQLSAGNPAIVVHMVIAVMMVIVSASLVQAVPQIPHRTLLTYRLHVGIQKTVRRRVRSE